MADRSRPLRAAKLVLLGDMGTGKSSLVLRFVKGQFTDYQVRPPLSARHAAPRGGGAGGGPGRRRPGARGGAPPPPPPPAARHVEGGGASPDATRNRTALLEDGAEGAEGLGARLTFRGTQESTIGAAFLTKSVPEHSIKFEIWDTAGQERYHSLAPMYYRGAAAAVVVYDITNQESFARAESWVRELQQQDNPGLVLALAGNKIDLEQNRQVTVEDAQAFAAQNGCLFLETSAKAGTNVSELFMDIASRIPGQTSGPPQAPQGLVLADNQKGGQKKPACC